MRKKRKSRIHDSGKGTTRQLLSFAREARDDPELLIPECASDCARCPFEAILHRLKRLSSLADDKRALEWASRWGGDLERAYAGMVLLAGEDDLQAVANLCLGEKTVSYAVRGHPPIMAIAGLQNWSDPEVRLLAYRKTARKLGVCLYSTSESLICTGPEPKPPKEFLEEVASIAGYGGLGCDHKGASPLKLRFSFPGGNKFEACTSCASSGTSFGPAYMARSCERNPLAQADIRFALDAECDGPCEGSCPSKVDVPVDPRKMKLYIARRLSDSQILQDARQSVVQVMEPGAIVVGGRCFGNGPERLTDALAADELERQVLKAALTDLDRPILQEAMTINKVLSEVWPDRGRDVLRAVGGEEARKLFNPSDGQPMSTVRQAVSAAKRKEMDSELPTYNSLGPVAALADSTARACKAGGHAEACERLDRHKSLDHRGNAVALAFYIAMGQEANRMWKYGREEADLGKALAPLAREMLESRGMDYDRALRNLLRMSGSGEEPR
jgi:hypothetical protein